MQLHRRSFLAGAGIAGAGLAVYGGVLAAAARPRAQRGFVGCYTTGQGPKDLGVHPTAEGIYTFTLDPATGKGSDFHLAARCPSPTNLLLHPDGRTLYAAQGGNFGRSESATWSAYRIGRSGLTAMGSAPAGGTGPTHGMIDKRGRYLVTTNFASNEVVSIWLGRDGRLGDIASRIVNASQPSGPPPPPGTPLLPAAHSSARPTTSAGPSRISRCSRRAKTG
jgi:Lactonase, 7-bladed beta-propeller